MKKPRDVIGFPNNSAWEKLINRWATHPACGEKSLLCAVIAGAICDDYIRARRNGDNLCDPSDMSFYFRGEFPKHARLIGLGADFLIEQVIRAAGMVGQEYKEAA